MKRGIVVDIKRQHLWTLDDGRICREAAVSTAINGPGEQQGSGCTPRGWHEICERIGEGCPINTVFVGRRPTGEIYTPELAVAHPERDWVLTRILWLSGLDEGRNQGGEVDSRQRYVYIHGCPDELPLGVPLSHGCIRMHSAELMDLFVWTRLGERVLIVEDIEQVADSEIREALLQRRTAG